MSIEKNSSSFGLANYLSPTDIRRVIRLTRRIQSAKKIEEVLNYQKQLAFLMAKAENNKKQRENMIRRQAMELKKLDKEQIRERYLNSRVKSDNLPVGASPLVEENSDDPQNMLTRKFRWEFEGEGFEINDLKPGRDEERNQRVIKLKEPEIREVQGRTK